jgi:tyrosinase
MLSRRAFLAASASALSIFGAIRHIGAQGRAVVRRSIGEMGNDDPDLTAYRRAVAAMKALPPADPRNWNRFANIHRNFCPHGNWYFLPWHRAYLTAFERICRELSGKPDFALPYWDWTADRQLPAAFARGDTSSNPLFHRRVISPTDTLPDDMVGRAVMTSILRSPDFEAFGSTRPNGQDSPDSRWLRREGTRTELEFNPHDGVHTTVGGDMAQVSLASRDPIFWLHHANVDRIWVAWNRLGNENSREADWLEFEFMRHFPNPDGSAWNVAVSDLQSTPALGYRYADEAVAFDVGNAMDAYAADPILLDPLRGRIQQDIPDGPAPRSGLAARRQPPRQLLAYRRMNQGTLARSVHGTRRIALASGDAIYVSAANIDRAASREQPIGIPVPLGRPLQDVLNARMPSAVGSHNSERRIWATIRDIEPPRDKTTRLRVFVNCENFSQRTQIGDPSYATSISFFSGEHARHNGGYGPSVSVNLTPTLRKMNRIRLLQGDRVTLQLLPQCRGSDAAGSRVRARRVEVVVI